MTAETDIAAVADGGDNPPSRVRDALTSVLARADFGHLGQKPGTPDTPDSNWASGLGNYTAVAGSAGSVNLLNTTTTTAIYDLSSRPGWLLAQLGHAQNVELRCDYTLPTNRSIILALSGNKNPGGDNMALAVRLNNNDTSSTSGTFVAAMLEQDTVEFVMQGNSSANATGVELGAAIREFHQSELVYLRIIRTGLVYSTWFSVDGYSWTYAFEQSVAAALDNVWIGLLGASAAQTYMPIVAIPWIREGSNGINPW